MGILAACYLLLLVAFSRALAKLSGSQLRWYLDPVVLFTSVWIPGYLLYASPVYQYRESITPEATAYVMAAHTLFVLGTLLGGLFARGITVASAVQRNSAVAQKPQYSFRLLAAIGCVGLTGLVAVTVDAALASSIGLSQRLGDGSLNQIRQETFAAAAAGVRQGPLARLEQFTAAAFLFVGLLCAMPSEGRPAWQRRLLLAVGAVSVLMIVFNQLFILGGRMDVVVLFLLIAFSLAASPGSHARHVLAGFVRRRWPVLFLFGLPIALLALYLLAVVFLQERVGNTNPLTSLYLSHRMQLAPDLERVVSGSPVLGTLMLSLSYSVVPLSTHSFYFGLSDAALSGPYWGQYNFQYLTSFVMRYLGYAEDWMYFWNIRDIVWTPLRTIGYGTNVWATLLRDLAIDFGWGGALFGVFVIGIGSKWLALKAIAGKHLELVVAYGAAAVFLVFSFAHSMFFIKSVFPPFTYAIVLYAFLGFRRYLRPRSRAVVQRPPLLTRWN